MYCVIMEPPLKGVDQRPDGRVVRKAARGLAARIEQRQQVFRRRIRDPGIEQEPEVVGDRRTVQRRPIDHDAERQREREEDEPAAAFEQLRERVACRPRETSAQGVVSRRT